MSILPPLTCMHTFDCSLVWSCRSRYVDIHKINVVAHLLNTLAAICHSGSVYSRFMVQYFKYVQNTIMVILPIWEVKLYQNGSSYIKMIKKSVVIHFYCRKNNFYQTSCHSIFTLGRHFPLYQLYLIY